MNRRKKIVLLLNWRKSWMGGLIYIVNLVNVLNYLEDSDRPELIVLYKEDLGDLIAEMHYPYLSAVSWQFPGFAEGYLLSWITGRNVFVSEIIRQYRPDGIYPLNDWPLSNRWFQDMGVRVVSWFPDLQHKFYPHFFAWYRVLLRELRLRLILRHAHDLVVSSDDVKSHFHSFYRLRSTLCIHTLRFVTILPATTVHNFVTLRKKYGIPARFFLVSNQFTNHKNHPIILEALRLLAERGRPAFVVMTGKTDFKGNDAYIADIRAKIQAYQLQNQVVLVGVIPRMDQLELMKQARAVLQPSFFEGWSTVIEDAKSVGVPVVAAALPVNREQLGDSGYYFDPRNPNDLADLLDNFESDGRHQNYEPYLVRAKRFAQDFVSIFQ